MILQNGEVTLPTGMRIFPLVWRESDEQKQFIILLSSPLSRAQAKAPLPTSKLIIDDDDDEGSLLAIIDPPSTTSVQ